MGKGKKKGAKGGEPKAEPPPIESLTLSESQASTSGEPAASAPAPAPAEVKPQEEDEDEGGLGLGLGKSRKKRPKKKKEATPPAESAGPAGRPAETAPPAEPAPAPPQQTAVPAPAPATPWAASATPWGQGRGGPPQTPPGFVGPQQGPSSHSLPAQQPSYPGVASPAPPGFAPGFPQPGFAQPGFTQPGFPQPGPAQPGFAQPGPAQRQPTQGRGRGAPGPPGPPGVQAARPVAPPAARPAPVVQSPAPQTASQQTPRPRDTEVSLFKIPPKFPSQIKVPCRNKVVLANYLPMVIQPLKIYRYDVSFKPDKPKKMIPRAFIEAKKKNFPNHLIAFDQMKNCYCLNPLPNVPTVDRFATNIELIDNNGKTMRFEVSFKATGVVDLNTILQYMKLGGSSLNPPTEAIQCVDVILRQGTLENYVKAGRQFFKRPAQPIDLGDGLEMWTGLFQSAIFTSAAFINIDVAHKGFPRQQPLLTAIQRDFRLDISKPLANQRGRGIDNFLQFIKGLRVIAKVGGDDSQKGQKREFICNELVDPANKMMFTMTDPNGREMKLTVADYFTKVKKIRLQYPNQNCMWVGPRDKNIFYPIELLDVSYGQALNKQLNEMQLSTMVKKAATPPDERKRKIEEVIKDMNYSRNADFKKFGLEIKNEFIQVAAKVLMPPNLDVGMRDSIQPNRGQWMARRLLKPEALDSWGLIAIELDMRQSNGETIISLIRSEGANLGMRISEPAGRFYNTDMTRVPDILSSAVAKGIKFIFVVVPTRGRDYYHRVKKMAERDVGILTQCIKEATAAQRMNGQTAKNILLKVNSKLMGVNQALDKRSMPRCLADGGVMVVGADVTHPSPDQSSVPSIAAVTASIDNNCFVYNIQLSVQTPKKEMIVEFEDMMVEHFQVYIKRQGRLPKKIFVFRDGVSEGQFAQVMNSELMAVHKAYQRLTGNQTRPEVLFLLVQKRHHTRFFNVEQNSASFNVEPGTVVDTHIVHAKELDFYLVSHQAIKGTARPTRYHAVCNDGHIPHDEVEQLTYYLCHLYSRCMRAVSYPTPTYYAHLACLRARSLTYGEKFNNQDLEKNPQRLRVLDHMLDFSRMFFV